MTDPTETLVLAGASVKAVAVTTGIETKAVSDSVGLYNITHLTPGEYTVQAEAQGFKRFIQEHIVLEVDSTVRVDPKLEMGAMTQEITVTAAPALLKSEKTDVATDIQRACYRCAAHPRPQHDLSL